MARKTVTRPETLETSPRLEELRVVRYSDIAGRDGVKNMVQRLWEVPTDADSDEGLGSLGIKPLDTPGLVSNPQSGSESRAQTRWLIFDAGDSVKALYVFGSAAKDHSMDGSYNVFTDILCRLVTHHRPKRRPSASGLHRLFGAAGRSCQGSSQASIVLGYRRSD